MAGDNFQQILLNGAIKHHPLAQSAPLFVIIRTKESIAAEIRLNLQSVRSAIKALLRRQEKAAAQTSAIQQSIKRAGQTTPQQQTALANLAARQADQAARANQITRTLEHIVRIARRNKLDQSVEGKLATLAATQINEVGTIHMPNAAVQLTRGQEESHRADSALKAADSLARAGQSQNRAIHIMRNLLKMLGDQGAFESLVAKTTHLLHQQELLQKQLRALAAKTVGMNIHQLPSALQQALHQLAHQQKILASKTTKLTRQASNGAGPASTRLMTASSIISNCSAWAMPAD